MIDYIKRKTELTANLKTIDTQLTNLTIDKHRVSGAIGLLNEFIKTQQEEIKEEKRILEDKAQALVEAPLEITK